MGSPYEEGKQAFRDGKVAADNPYPCSGTSGPGMNAQCYDWRNGWEDERHIVQFGFAPNEIVGPIK